MAGFKKCCTPWNKGLKKEEHVSLLNLSEKLKKRTGEKNHMFGRKHSLETRKKISENRKGKCISIDNPFYGKQHSEESREKMSIAKKGKKLSMEHRAKMSKSRKGKPSGAKGRHHSMEARLKISIGNKGKTVSEKTRIKLHNANLGQKHSEEQRRKNREWHTGRKLSEDAKKKISGANNPNWLGGKSFEPYTTDWTRTLRRSIRERDHYTCQICGELQGDKALDIHHADYDKKNCNPQNLISLCKCCHTKTNHNRSNWIVFFLKPTPEQMRKVAKLIKENP
ncbi:MAG: NUMOD3 domain-containing DNA-binding protein [Patescibacteria group bacterium]|jgi:hypothetical protein